MVSNQRENLKTLRLGVEHQLHLGQVSPEMLAAIRETEQEAKSENTLQGYAQAWTRFERWCREHDFRALPAGEEVIKAYLHTGVTDRGWRWATARYYFTAIADAHSRAGHAEVVLPAIYREFLRGVRRRDRRPQRQAKPLSERDMAAVRAVPCPGRFCGRGRCRRVCLDIALLETMWVCMLRSDEAAELLWGDIEFLANGAGILEIRWSKSDQLGAGAQKFLPPRTVKALRRIAGRDPRPSAPVFGLTAQSIGERVKRACERAGLGHGYSGHSPRRGYAQVLADAGFGQVQLMEAGRWQDPKQVERYLRRDEVFRSAAALYEGVPPDP